MNLQLIKQDKFNEILVDVYRNDNDEVFMTSAQLAEALEYADKKGVERIVERNDYLKNEEFSVQLKVKVSNGKLYRTRLFNKHGIRMIISVSQRPFVLKNRVLEILNIGGSVYNHMRTRDEDEYIHLIQTSLSSFDSEREAALGPYRCDLLFTEYNLIVECDEYGHASYDKVLEEARTEYLTNEGYHIIRFNPNSKSFYIGDVISGVLSYLLSNTVR